MTDDTDAEPTEVGGWDVELTRRVMGLLLPILKVYHRSEVRGLDRLPAGPCLVVGNHTGGMLTPDAAVFAVDFYRRFGYVRPLYVLAHDAMFRTPAVELLHRLGVVPANPQNAAAALAAGAATLVYPGGDYDVYRPTVRENLIDFAGRTGYIQAAVTAEVPWCRR